MQEYKKDQLFKGIHDSGIMNRTIRSDRVRHVTCEMSHMRVLGPLAKTKPVIIFIASEYIKEKQKIKRIGFILHSRLAQTNGSSSM